MEESKEMHNKHLMTGAKENSVFWFPEFINVPRGEARAQLIPLIEPFGCRSGDNLSVT